MPTNPYKKCLFLLDYGTYLEGAQGYYNLADGLALFKKGFFGIVEAVGLPDGTRVYDIRQPRSTFDKRLFDNRPNQTRQLIVVDMTKQLATYIGGTPNLTGQDIADLNLLLSVVFAKKVTDALASFTMSLSDRLVHMLAGAGVAVPLMLLIFWAAGKL